MKDFDTLQKLPKNVGNLGKISVAKGFENETIFWGILENLYSPKLKQQEEGILKVINSFRV